MRPSLLFSRLKQWFLFQLLYSTDDPRSPHFKRRPILHNYILICTLEALVGIFATSVIPWCFVWAFSGNGWFIQIYVVCVSLAWILTYLGRIYEHRMTERQYRKKVACGSDSYTEALTK